MVDAPGSLALAPPRGRRRCFLALMVDATRSSAPAPSRGAPSTLYNVDDCALPDLQLQSTVDVSLRWWWTLLDHQLRHLPMVTSLTFSNIDGGRSRISSSGTSQGARCRRFLALVVDAPGSSAPAHPMGTTVDVF
jgi:hypothetical protein